MGIREALEMNRLKTLNETDKTFKVLNRDNDDYVTTNSWKSLFQSKGNHLTIVFMFNFTLVQKRVSLSQAKISLTAYI